MFKIGDIKITNKIIAGPMAGISNAAFRELLFENDAGLVYTEMVSDKAIIYKNEKTLKMCEIDDHYHPVSIQLFGSEVDSMVKAAIYLDQMTNADIIDINMGCPMTKVIKTGAGSALMRTPDLALEIVSSIIKNVKKPITVKMRLGFTKDEMNYLDLAKRLEGVGVKAIALHARTRSQMYEGEANWSHVKRLKEELSIPVFGNGDIRTVDDIKRRLEETACDAVMVARALVGDPFLIKKAQTYLQEGIRYDVSITERFAMCLRHASKLCALYGENTGMRMMREITPHYLRGLANSAKVRSMTNRIDTYRALVEILDNYKKDLAL